MDDDEVVDSGDDLRVREKNTFLEVVEKKPESARRKSAPASLRKYVRQSHSFEVGSLLSTMHHVPCSVGFSVCSAKACGNEANACEEEVLLNPCTLKREASFRETRDADLHRSPDITQVPDRAQGEHFLTFMVCDLPCKVGEKRMMTQLQSMGFDGCYDYLYFPKRKRDAQYGEGYCFINFMRVEVALRFKTRFHGHRFCSSNSLKQARVEVANIQGLEANIRLFANQTDRPKYISDTNGIRVGSQHWSA
eukprot:TRINITY_DN10177_c0_g1_i2.p1 TRINITY_DN10177_c0_g1~~TRINITY_DN10177_c0_g1_i2.p1  ORF type:complete len:250 (-),score=24.50 TRINITY_DN10177_c0_g1_i2:269-1018(-)